MADPYLSPAVRSVIEHPVPDATIRLRLTLVEDEPPEETLAEAIRAVDGTIDRSLPFDALEVTIPQERVDALREIETIAAIETAATVSITGDAGEDVRFDANE